MRPEGRRRVKTNTYAKQHRIAAGGRRGGPRDESGRHHPLPHRHGLGTGLRRHFLRRRGADIPSQAEREQEINARAVRLGRHDRPLRQQGPGNRLRGDGAGHLAPDGHPAGRRRACRKPHPRRRDARRAHPRPRILPPDAPRPGTAHRLDLGQHLGRSDARGIAGRGPRDHRRRGFRRQPPFRRQTDPQGVVDHRVRRRRRGENHHKLKMAHPKPRFRNGSPTWTPFST